MKYERHFQEGDVFEIPPIRYEVVKGRKSTDDLKLEWSPMPGWNYRRGVELDHVFLIFDFISDNENILYPPPHQGAGMVLQAVANAYKLGWRQARHNLHLQRQHKHDKKGNYSGG